MTSLERRLNFRTIRSKKYNSIMKYPIILIDNGHGRNTPGKCSPDASNGLIHSPLYFREYSWARKCAQAIASVLTFEGYTAFLLVKEEEDIPLQERTNRVNAYCRTYGKENVILVSVHANAAKSDRQWHEARGWCVYTSPGKTKSDKLATCLYEAAKEELEHAGYTQQFQQGAKQKPIRTDFSDGDADYEANFWMLTKSNCVAVLTENLFQDNKEDVAFLKSDKGLGAITELHVKGIKEFIKSL